MTALGDWNYAKGMEENLPPQRRIEYLRQAARYNPFDHTSRMIAASIMGQFAINSHDPGWLNAAKIEIGKTLETESTDALLSGDSRRKFPLRKADRVTLTKDDQTVRLAHLKEILFTDRLVAKFKLPIEGWRGE